MPPPIPHRRPPVVRAFFAALLLAVSARGALTWATLRLDQTTPPNATEAVGVFRFANQGAAPVTITNVQPTCGCTTATLEKRTYAPGESGEIKAVFTIGNRVGEQEKSIYVVTDDPSAKPVSLVFRVTIPELLAYSPRLLIWRIGGGLDEKVSTLTATGAGRITTLELTVPVPAGVEVRTAPVEAGKKYELHVRPGSTAQTLNVTVAGTATFADGTKLPFAVYALVR